MGKLFLKLIDDDSKFLIFGLAILAYTIVLIWGLGKLRLALITDPTDGRDGKKIKPSRTAAISNLKVMLGQNSFAVKRPFAFNENSTVENSGLNYARVSGFTGSIGIAAFYIALGYWGIWALFFGNEGSDAPNIKTGMESLFLFFLYGSALFLPMAFERLSGLMKDSSENPLASQNTLARIGEEGFALSSLSLARAVSLLATGFVRTTVQGQGNEDLEIHIKAEAGPPNYVTAATVVSRISSPTEFGPINQSCNGNCVFNVPSDEYVLAVMLTSELIPETEHVDLEYTVEVKQAGETLAAIGGHSNPVKAMGLARISETNFKARTFEITIK